MHFFLGNGPMLDATGDDEKLAFTDFDRTLPELHAKAALDDEEEFVLVVMMMPDECTLKLHQLDVLAVEFPDDLGVPVRVKQGELLGEIDLVHG
jgi:hypothetical protein